MRIIKRITKRITKRVTRIIWRAFTPCDERERQLEESYAEELQERRKYQSWCKSWADKYFKASMKERHYSAQIGKIHELMLSLPEDVRAQISEILETTEFSPADLDTYN